MPTPLVTIVIPVHNRADIVGRTLDSVAAQTVRPLRVVLVDNNSTDNTLEVLQRWRQQADAPDFRVDVIEEKRPGACAARNAGLALVDTEWTMFFDSDDEMMPEHVQRALDTAAANPDAGVIGWDSYWWLDGRRLPKRYGFTTRDMLYNNVFHSIFSTQRYMARTSIFRAAGGWDESTQIFDDAELGNRILLRVKPEVAHVEGDVTIKVNVSRESIMNTPDGKLDRMRAGLDAIERELPERCKHWADLMRLLMASTVCRHDVGARELAREVLARQPWPRRLLWRIYRAYSLAGGRGVACINRLITAGKI